MVGITYLQFSDIVLEENVMRNSAKFAIFIEEKTQKSGCFLDRHPMAVSRFHPGRFATVFGEAITLLFLLFFKF